MMKRDNIVIIVLNSNRWVSPYSPITEIHTHHGGCHVAFSPIDCVQGRGLNSESSWIGDHFWIEPLPGIASHNLNGLIHWYPSNQSSSTIVNHTCTNFNQIHVCIYSPGSWTKMMSTWNHNMFTTYNGRVNYIAMWCITFFVSADPEPSYKLVNIYFVSNININKANIFSKT